MTQMIKPRINGIQHLGIGCLMAVCLMSASVPAGFAKKGGVKTQEA